MKKEINRTRGEMMQIDNPSFACDLSIESVEYYYAREILEKPETKMFDIQYPDIDQGVVHITL